MTMYGVSAKFLDFLSEKQREGVSGHIEWFPPTMALRYHYRITFIQHALKVCVFAC